MSPSSNAIFISRASKEVLQLKLFAEINHLQLFAKSMIKFESVPAKINVPFDVIFFGSPRAIKYYFAQHKLPEGISLACVGKSTADKLIEFGYSAAFIGEENKAVSEIAIDFKNWLMNRHVLFPLSDKSFKTFASLLPEDQKTEIVVYRTISDAKKIPECQYYVFTSPSNVDSFLSINTIPPEATIVSWGESTHRHLSEIGLSSEMLINPSIDALITWFNKKGGFRLP